MLQSGRYCGLSFFTSPFIRKEAKFMKTKYLKPQDGDLKIAAELLKGGGTVIFPTETVYGLGANALDSAAIKKIYEAKGRPSDNPLIVHIASADLLPNIVREIPACAKQLMERFWPGPLTLIFQKSDQIPYAVTGGMETVAVRMPSHPVARELLTYANLPIAAPSANRSGYPSPTAFAHVKRDMDGRVDAIIDGGDCSVGVESTVLDISGKTPVLYRPGGVTKEELEKVVGTIRVVTEAKTGEAPKSPGLKYKHYAPRAEVLILHGSFDQVQNYVKNRCETEKVGMLVFDEFPTLSPALVTYSLGGKNNPQSAAHRLFDGLRSLDDAGVSLILAPEIPDYGMWSAVRNRLYRASGNRVLDLDKPKKSFLFVCTGNTCRSPMAEGIFRHMADAHHREYRISSAGICASGAPASENAIAAMQEIGIDLRAHRSAPITEEKIKNADCILTMTKAHRQMLCNAFSMYADKISTLSAWGGEDTDVSDPYGGTLLDYQRCRDQIARLLQKGWERHL